MSKPTPRPLSGYALTNYFRKLRLRRPFSPLEAYLFFELVACCNDAEWPEEFSVSNGLLQGALGCSEQGLINARTSLERAGLLTYVSGNRRTPTLYRFTAKGSTEFSHSSPKGSTEFSQLAINGSTQGSTEYSHCGQNPANGSTQGSSEGSTEFSPYKEQTKTKTILAEGEGVGTQILTAAASEQAAPLASADKKPAGKRAKKAGADFAQIADLPLPHAGPEFAEAWRTFYTTNTKQAGKPLTAFELMLKKLGKRPESFAVVMLEAAIQGDWSGVENPGTARAFDTWQAEQRSRPPASLPPVPAVQEEELDEPARQFRAEQAEKAAAARAAHFARWAAK